MTDTTVERHALAERLVETGVLTSPALRKAVEAVPREAFLNPGVFLPAGAGQWRPVTAVAADPQEWAEIAYSDESLTTQLDGHLVADQAAGRVSGVPTSSSTTPVTVVGMIESLEVQDGHRVLEIGTGTGYSTALMCHLLGEDNVTTVEVDPEVAARADAALEGMGCSTWTVTGDGLLGHPARAPYDRVIATCAVRRIPYAWVRQTRPGGIILATVGSWAFGTGLAKVTVDENGTADGRIIGESSFMHARSQADSLVVGDLSARVWYADTERPTPVAPAMLDEWTPSFLAQLAAPGVQLVRATVDGQSALYLFDEWESFAVLAEGTEGWTVRQGGPAELWSRIEQALRAWQEAGRPNISAVRLHISKQAHIYWVPGHDALRWEHRLG